MKAKHLKHWVKVCVSKAALSNCIRRQFGCVVIDPQSNVIITEGYNGGLRDGGDLCAGTSCEREGFKSGSRLEQGCVHAEQNAIYNAARRGVSLIGSWFIINGEPCKLCAKAIVQVGATKVICVGGVYESNGTRTLTEASVSVHMVDDIDNYDYDSVMVKRISYRKQNSTSSSPFT
tara:strand:- start:1856 stop:2383 length:528 start_codon:yes stop_codon:yes gene_type:complete